MIKSPKHIVISRTDSIGDVVLTLPVAGILKEKYPSAKITFLGNTYTRPVIQCCTHVDEIWEWAEFDRMNYNEQVDWLKEKQVDVFIHVFPRRELARVVKKAGIPHRIGTSHRLFHLMTCNHRPSFTRKRSEEHEAQLNTRLLSPLGIKKDFSLEELFNFSGFTRIPPVTEKTEKLLYKGKRQLIFHPKSKGSAIEWGVDNFIQLAKELDPDKFNIYFTGTSTEAEYFRSKLPVADNIFDLSSQLSLDELIHVISKADLLLAASTGPLHIAGVCNKVTIGLFTTKKPMHAGRWKPLGNKVIILEGKNNSSESQPLDIDLRVVKKAIEESL